MSGREKSVRETVHTVCVSVGTFRYTIWKEVPTAKVKIDPAC